MVVGRAEGCSYLESLHYFTWVGIVPKKSVNNDVRHEACDE